ncbi:pilus assembly protein N-terminal domain-containing protein [Rhizobium sp. LjRoot254]|uniref:pilus assembly protein N-terminal domain-containing protein n=1 Tax=Rhizobium sp. LjRoot254 TaxID=3342297 RepID=UPI003ED16A3F
MRVGPTLRTSLHIIYASVFAVAASLAVPAIGLAEDEEGMMRVFLNHAKVLKLDQPVSKVIVGNSEVADATVADSRTIVLTGKAFGTTNLVLLDAEGNALLDERILVSIDEGNTVRLFKQTERTVLSCTPSCEEHQALTGGDSK